MPPDEGQNQELVVTLKFADEGVSRGLADFRRNLDSTVKSATGALGSEAQQRSLKEFGKQLGDISKNLRFAGQSADLAGKALGTVNSQAGKSLQAWGAAQQKAAGLGASLSGMINPGMSASAALAAIVLSGTQLRVALGLLGDETATNKEKLLALNTAAGTLASGVGALTGMLIGLQGKAGLLGDVLQRAGGAAIATGSAIASGLTPVVRALETAVVALAAKFPAASAAMGSIASAAAAASGSIGRQTASLAAHIPGLTTAAAKAGVFSKAIGGVTSAIAVGGKAFLSYLPLIGTIATVIGVTSEAIDKNREAVLKGESTWKAFAEALFDGGLKIGRQFAFLGGPATLAAYALGEALVRTGVHIAAFNASLVTMQIEAARWVANAFIHPQEAIRQLGEAIRQTATETIGFIDRMVSAIPGPISQAKDLMVSGGKAVANGVGLATTAVTGLIGGLAALTFEMRQSESISKAFDLSMSKMGLSGKELVASIQEQSKGLVSQIEIMEKANTASSLIGDAALKAAGGADKVLGRMVTSSMAAARSTGQSVEYMFDSMVMGVGRASPMILDNLGLSLKLGDTYEQAAKKLGKSSKELTITEQKVALLNAVLDKGDEIAKRYGITSGGVNTQVQRFNVTMKDLAFRIGLAFSPVLRDLLIVFNDFGSILRGVIPLAEKVAGAVMSIPAPIRNAVLAFSALNVAMSLITTGPAQQLLGVLGLSADRVMSLLGPLRLLAPILITAFTAWQTNAFGVRDATNEMAESFGAWMAPLLPRLNQAQAAWTGFVGQLGLLQPLASAAIKNILLGDVDTGIRQLQQVSSAVLALVQKLFGDLSGLVGTGAAEMVGAWLEGFLGGVGTRLAQIFGQVIPMLLQEGARWIRALADGIVAGISALEGMLVGIGQGLGQRIVDGLSSVDPAGLTSAVGALLSALASSIGQIYTSLVSLIGQVWQEAINFIITAGPSLLSGFAGMVESVAAELPGTLSAFTAALLDWASGAIDGLYMFFTDGLVGAVDTGVADSVDRIQNAVSNLAYAVMSWITESAHLLDERMPEWGAKLTEIWEDHLMPAILEFLKTAGAFMADNIHVFWDSLPPKWKLFAVMWIMGFDVAKLDILAAIWTFKGEIWATFKASLKALWDSLPTLIEIGAVQIETAIESLLRLLLDGAVGLVNALIPATIGGAIIKLVTLIPGVGWVLKAALFLLGTDIGASILSLTASILGQIGTVILELIAFVIGYFWGLGESLRAWFEETWASTSAWFSALWDSIKAWAARLTESGTWSGFWENLKTELSYFAERAWETLKGEAMALWDRASSFFSNMGQRVGEAFTRGVNAGSGGQFEDGGAGAGGEEVYGPAGVPQVYGPPSPTGSKSSAPPSMGGGGAPEEPPGDKGKGKKEPKGKGEGTKKDPVKEAFEKISTIANAVRDGIAAMKAVWTEFLGAPPSELMDQVFAALQSFAERGIELAKSLKLDVDDLPALKGGLEILQSTLQGFQGVISAGDAIMRARLPNPARILATFETMRVFATEGLALSQSLMTMPLEDAVKTSALAQEMGKVITSIADAAIKSSEATGAISGGRWDADFSSAKAFFMAAIGLAVEATSEFTRLTAGKLLPRAIVESDMVAKSVVAWADSISKSADAATKMEQTRYPTNLDDPRRLLGQVMEMGLELTSSFTTKFGDQFMIVAEDMGIVAGAMSAFIGPVSEICDAAQKVFDTRAGISLEPARDLLLQVMEIGQELTSKMPSATILRMAEDMTVTAGALGAWAAPLAAIPDVVRAAEVASTRPMPIEPLKALLDSILQVAGSLTDAHLGRIAGKIALALADQKTVGEALGVWVKLLADLDDVVTSLETASINGRLGAVQGNIEAAKGILQAIGKMAWELTQAAAGQLDAKGMLQALADGQVVAAAFVAWLEPLKGLADVLASLRLAGGHRKPEDSIKAAGAMLKAVGAEAWGLVKDIIKFPGTADLAVVSQTIAATYGMWIDVFKSAADLTLNLRQMRGGEIGPQLVGLHMMLKAISVLAFDLIKDIINNPGTTSASGVSQTIAATLAAWLNVFSAATDFSRKVRAFKAPGSGWATPIQQFILDIGEVGKGFTDTWVNQHYADPGGDAGIMGAVADMLAGWAGAFAAMADSSRQIRHFVEPTAREWGAVLGAVRFIWENFRPLTDEYIKDLYDWGLEAGPKATAWSKAVEELASAVKAVADIGLRNYVEPNAREWAAVEAALREMWRRFASIAGEVMPEVLEDAQDLALYFAAWKDSVVAIAEAVSAVAGIQLHEYVEPLDGEWAAVGRAMTKMWGHFKVLAESMMPELLVYGADLAAMMTQWSETVAAIADAVNATAGIQLHLYIEPLASEFDAVGRSLTRLWAIFKPMSQRMMPELLVESRDLAEQIKLWQESVEAIVSAVVGVSGIFLIRENVTRIGVDALRVVKDNISLLFSEFGVMARQWASELRVPEVTAGEIGHWSEAVGAILEAVGTALETAIKFSGELVPKLPRAGMLARLKTTIRYVMDLFAELTGGGKNSLLNVASQTKGGGDPRRAAAEQEEMWRRMAAFSESLGSQVGGLTDTIDLLVTLAEQGHKLANISSTVKSILREAISTVVTMWGGLANDFQQGSSEARAAVARSAEFAGSVAAMVKPLGDIADTILKLDGFIWETFQLLEGEKPARPNSPWRYGSKPPDDTTPAGAKRYRRLISVAREDIARILSMAKDFMDEVRILMDQMVAEFEARDPEGDFEKFMADLGGFMEKATAAGDLAIKTSEAIEALFNNALTVSIFGSGPARSGELVSAWWLKVRERRADWAAKQLKESFKRQVSTLVGAVREALAEVNKEGGIPNQEMVGPLNILAAVVSAIANAITQIMEMPTVEEARIRALVSAVNLLSDIVLPDWMFGDAVAGSLNNLMLLLDKLNVIDPDRIKEAIAALNGFKFDPVIIDFPLDKWVALTEFFRVFIASGGTGQLPVEPPRGSEDYIRTGPQRNGDYIRTGPQSGGSGEGAGSGYGSHGGINLPVRPRLLPLTPEEIQALIDKLNATLDPSATSRGGLCSLPIDPYLSLPDPAGIEYAAQSLRDKLNATLDPSATSRGGLCRLPVTPYLTEPDPGAEPGAGGGDNPWDEMIGKSGTVLSLPGLGAWVRGLIEASLDGFFINPYDGGVGDGVPGAAAFDYDRLGIAIGAAIPPADIDVQVDVQPAVVNLEASLEFPEGAYDLIARRIRDRRGDPALNSPTTPLSIGNRARQSKPQGRRGS